ncbi:MAG: hypothetical protein QM529_02375 [Hydrotalea sp.]|nr:hypothetical protein [Hydrotalea sp.]
MKSLSHKNNISPAALLLVAIPLTMVMGLTHATTARAQDLSGLHDNDKSGIKATFGGGIGGNIGGNQDAGTNVDLPSWMNFFSLKVDGQVDKFGLTYGGFLRYRPFDGADGPDKAYVYIAQKTIGKLSLGRDSTVIGNQTIDAAEIVPGNSQNSDNNDNKTIAASLYNKDILDITAAGNPLGVSYVTPKFFGVTLGYSYILPPGNAVDAANDTTAVGDLAATHDAMARYDGEFGPISFSAMAGARYGNLIGNSSGHVVAYTAGAKFRYTDAKNIGVQLAGGYHHAHNLHNAAKASAWSVGVAFDTPRVSGLTLGLLFARGDRSGPFAAGDAPLDLPTASDNNDKAIYNYHLGVGVGYAWSDNFSQTLSYDKGFGGNAGDIGNGYGWALSNQLSF